MADNEVYEVEQVVWEKSKGTSGSLKERSLNFNEIEFPVTGQEQREQDDWDLEHGQTTEAKILMRDDPDGYKDEKEAQKEVDRRKLAGTPARRAVFERDDDAA